ncbi:DUF5011 domain-containing protein [Pseudoalteromonas arctica]|uniref:DUF5011 domain-containing protein n=1 Tax=Pseudoalteromonas arctica TaxID=394751 RepID=A0A7Y0DPP7_9GAMM|nr:DUF5011 domain-containing protein [Pseudoalteromonas arctica]NMM39334.1 DUF5011 domain-containing protein [Pseudoalteromonas arctica]
MCNFTKLKKLKYLQILAMSLILGLAGCGSDNDANKSPPPAEADTVAPVITITGESAVSVNQNEKYIEQGATATDNVDGTITVVITGDVNTSITGEYLVTYTATDTAGNAATAIRTVTVVSVTLSGTAAAGAAIVGTVTVKGANGKVKSSPIAANGSYAVNVTGLVAPYRLRAQGTVGGRYYKLHSYAAAANVGGTVNITPFSDLIIANTAQQLAENYFQSDSFTELSSAALTAQEGALQAKLQNVFDALGLDAAINLLSSSFKADHSGLDAALDLIRISVNEENNIATITNTLDGSSITDDITQSDDNDAVIEVDSEKVGNAVTDRVAIASLFANFSAAFNDGLPEEDDITGYFATEFLSNDADLALFLTDFLTDPLLIGVSFNSLAITELDSANGSAVVGFNVAYNGHPSFETEQWYVAKDSSLGWQFLGDQQIVDLDFIHYHCNDYDGTDSIEGSCGINTSFSDNDFNNNGTQGMPILSAAISVISPQNGSVKDTFFLGTPINSTEGLIYDENNQAYSGDWRAFGTNLGEIDASKFSVGDKIKYRFYTNNLDLSDASMPTVSGQATAVYSRELNYLPVTTGLYPTAPQTTLDNLNNFTLGNDLVVEWTLADDTQIDEVLVEITDNQDNHVLSIWALPASITDTSITFNAAMFDQELLGNDQFQPELGYQLLIRIYAKGNALPQYYSTDYRASVAAQASFACNYESGWNDSADNGLGAPINPNSFNDFKQVIASCGNTVAITKSEVLGHSWLNEGERVEFYDTGSATQAAPSTGKFIEGSEQIDFIWYIETIGDHTFVVQETNSDLDNDLPTGFWIREAYAVIAVTTGQAGETIYSAVIYAEQSNYSDLDRDTNSDGEIWNNSYIIESLQ